jgi:uncharacterized protein
VRLGVPRGRIAYEFFGLASALEGVAALAASTLSGIQPVLKWNPAPKSFTFAKSNLLTRWDKRYASLLDFAEANGLAPEFSCGTGVCSTCKTTLDQKVLYTTEPLAPPGEDEFLLCCAQPSGSAKTLLVLLRQTAQGLGKRYQGMAECNQARL